MQCSYFINGSSQCKLRTSNPIGYCHRHKRRALNNYRFPKPETCPVCFSSIHQCLRPLYCGHWVHRRCVQKTNKTECPICRQHLPDLPGKDETLEELIEELLADPNIQRIEIPQDAVVFAVITYQLYANILNPHDRTLNLHHFISGAIHDMVPLENRRELTTILHAEALRLFLEPENLVE